jgi:amidophosphoribosyltransferase
MMLDGIGESCGVIGVWAPDLPISHLVYSGLIGLQHRGQESAGIAVADGAKVALHRGMGLVQQVFRAPELTAMHGHTGIGHVRYSTTGESTIHNAQPFTGRTRSGEVFALAHNGNLVRVGQPCRGSPQADTLALVRSLERHRGRVDVAMTRALPQVDGAYSLVVLDRDTLYAVRDPHGFRPLCLGRLAGCGWAVASESAALDVIGASYVRDVAPGELVGLDHNGLRSTTFAPATPAACSFEHVYFSRPDSLSRGRRLHQIRRDFGAALAEECPAEADVVIPVPDSARPAALGYAERSGIPYDEGLARNNYLGRTFIQPDQADRSLAVRLKLNPIPDVVAGNRVVVVDDSIVRATTASQVVAMLRAAGARQIHLRIASPPVRWPCFYGVDMKTDTELVASRLSPAGIAAAVGADSLGYLSVEAMAAAIGDDGLCTACFTGRYPVGVPAPADPAERLGAVPAAGPGHAVMVGS